MVDNAQTNLNVVYIIYGTRDPIVNMVNKEWKCFFHWTKSLNKHTKHLIGTEFHDQHKTFCYEYKKTTSLGEVDLRYATIWPWWYSSKVTNEGAIKELNNW
jgi:hypothetical protein